MSLGPEFYADNVAAMAVDTKTFANDFAAAVRRGDKKTAGELLERLEGIAWHLIDDAKSALSA